MKKLLAIFALLAFALPAYAEQQETLTERRTVYSDDRLAEMYFYESSSELTPQEEEILRQSLDYRENNPTGIKPFVRPDGSMVMVFGLGQQTIICAVLQITDIELQPGESVQDIHLGDTARWLVEPAITGSGTYAIQHLIIKPFDVGLDTTLVVTTNLRTYHFRLKSQRRDYMPRVSFAYPDAVQEKWRSLQQRQQSVRQAQTIPETGEYLGNLDFGYVVQGTASWKPVRVYNDGVKTIIQMPTIMQQLEAPTLLIVRHEGGLFSDEELVLVNYRVQSNRYIVDSVFDKAVMIIGVGGNQDRVTIIRSQEGGDYGVLLERIFLSRSRNFIDAFPLEADLAQEVLRVEKELYCPPLGGYIGHLLASRSPDEQTCNVLKAIVRHGKDFLEAYEIERIEGNSCKPDF